MKEMKGLVRGGFSWAEAEEMGRNQTAQEIADWL